MKAKTVLVVVLLILQSYAALPDEDPIVFITKTGEKYHVESCRYLKKSKIPIKLSEAKKLDYEACSVCKPPS